MAPHERGALIERVAKALCRFRHTPRSVEEAVAPGRELWMRYIPDAEVAIEAMNLPAPEGDASRRWYEAAAPYATPEALREALKDSFYLLEVARGCDLWYDAWPAWGVGAEVHGVKIDNGTSLADVVDAFLRKHGRLPPQRVPSTCLVCGLTDFKLCTDEGCQNRAG